MKKKMKKSKDYQHMQYNDKKSVMIERKLNKIEPLPMRTYTSHKFGNKR